MSGGQMGFGFELRRAENVQKRTLWDFPTGFRRRTPFYAPFQGSGQLSTASTDIIAFGPALRCDLCLRTAHSAAFPVRPFR